MAMVVAVVVVVAAAATGEEEEEGTEEEGVALSHFVPGARCEEETTTAYFTDFIIALCSLWTSPL